MKTTSKYILESVSKNCSNQLKLYKFNKNTLKVSKKYREGRVVGLKYIWDLTFYFIQEEKRIQILFHEEIEKQMKLYSCLGDTDIYRVSMTR